MVAVVQAETHRGGPRIVRVLCGFKIKTHAACVCMGWLPETKVKGAQGCIIAGGILEHHPHSAVFVHKAGHMKHVCACVVAQHAAPFALQRDEGSFTVSSVGCITEPAQPHLPGSTL